MKFRINLKPIDFLSVNSWTRLMRLEAIELTSGGFRVEIAERFNNIFSFLKL